MTDSANLTYTKNSHICHIARQELFELIADQKYEETSANDRARTMIAIVEAQTSALYNFSNLLHGLSWVFDKETAIAEYASWYSLIPDSIRHLIFIEIDRHAARYDDDMKMKIKRALTKKAGLILYNETPDIVEISSIIDPEKYIIIDENNSKNKVPKQHCTIEVSSRYVVPKTSRDRHIMQQDRKDSLQRIWEYAMTCEIGSRMSFFGYDAELFEDFSGGHIALSDNLLHRMCKFKEAVTEPSISLKESYRLASLIDMCKREAGDEDWFVNDVEALRFLADTDKCARIWFGFLYSKIDFRKEELARAFETGGDKQLNRFPIDIVSMREAGEMFGIYEALDAVFEKNISEQDIIIPMSDRLIVLTDTDKKLGQVFVSWMQDRSVNIWQTLGTPWAANSKH